MANTNFSCALEAWVSGNTIYARMHYWRSGTYHYLDQTFPTPKMTIDGTTFYDDGFRDWVRNGIDVGDVRTTTFSKSVGSNGQKWISFWAGSGVRSDFSGSWSTDVNVNFYIEGLWYNNARRSQESITANVYLSNWGAGTNYRELQLWTYSSSGLVTPRRWQPAYGGATSGDITVSNSSSGDLNIRGNTRYVIGVYADNGSTNTGSLRGDTITTLPYKDTLSLKKAHALSLEINYVVPADGGRYAKTLQYSIDNGNTWVTYDTISGGSRKESSFTISGLDPITQYTIRSRVTTNNGAYVVNNDNLVVSTIGPDTPVVTAKGATTDLTSWGYSTSTFGGGANGVVRLYIDTNSTPNVERENKGTLGESIYNYENLLANTRYWARARAESTFGTQLVYSDWSNTIFQTTICNPPELNSIGVMQYDSATTVAIRTNMTIPSDGNYFQKNIQYRYTDFNSNAKELKFDNMTETTGVSITDPTKLLTAIRAIVPSANLEDVNKIEITSEAI